MKDPISAFLKDETAATAIEYGLIAAGHLGRDHCGRKRSRNEIERDLLVDLNLAEVSELE